MEKENDEGIESESSVYDAMMLRFDALDEKVTCAESKLEMAESKFDRALESFQRFLQFFNIHYEETEDYVHSSPKYQIGEINVNEGGIGFQVNEESIDYPNVHGTKSESRVKESKSKDPVRFESEVFTYKWVDKHPEKVTEFYQMLVNLRAIDKKTDHEDFENLFMGVPTNTIVKWTAKKSALAYLMSELKTRNLISPGSKVWLITQSHFRDEKGYPFDDLRHQHNPEYLTEIINRIADVLEPTKEVPHIQMIDEDTADELWSGTKIRSEF